MQGFSDDLAERTLADSNGALDCNIPGWFKQVRHGRRKATPRRITCPGFRGNYLVVKEKCRAPAPPAETVFLARLHRSCWFNRSNGGVLSDSIALWRRKLSLITEKR